MSAAPKLAETQTVAAPAADGTTTLRRTLFAADAVALLCAWLATYSLVPAAEGAPNNPWLTLDRAAAMTVLCLLLAVWQRLYTARACHVRALKLSRLARVSVLAAALSAVAVAAGGYRPSVPAAIIGGLLTGGLLICVRGFYDAWLRAERARGRFTRRVVVVGHGNDAAGVIELLNHHPELGYRICGLVGDLGTALRHGVDWLGTPRQAVDRVVATGASAAVLVTAGMASADVNWLMRELLACGLQIQVSPGLWRVGHRRLRAAPLAYEPFYDLAPGKVSSRQLRVKRALDVAVVLPALVVLAPVLILTALAILLLDGRPVMFRQLRIGKEGRPFTLLKFRTMVVDAEARLGELRDRNQRQGPLFKVDQDPRVTKLGGFLRATSLDELPQLFNVLAGTMSIVGPRPALPQEAATFDEDLRNRHCLPPGVTGLWQLEARDNASFYAYRHLDLYYVENWSCLLDVVVMVSTVPALLARSVRSMLGRAEIAASDAA